MAGVKWDWWGGKVYAMVGVVHDFLVVGRRFASPKNAKTLLLTTSLPTYEFSSPANSQPDCFPRSGQK